MRYGNSGNHTNRQRRGAVASNDNDNDNNDARKRRSRKDAFRRLITGAPNLRLVLSDAIVFKGILGSWHACPILFTLYNTLRLFDCRYDAFRTAVRPFTML